MVNLKMSHIKLPNILVVNAGSSSLKLCLFTGEEQKRVQQNGTIDLDATFASYTDAPLTAIGHRVVHGGPKYTSSLWIDQTVMKEIERYCLLAPLHNIPSLKAIQYCSQKFADVPQYAVFDTAFHRTLPLHARTYAIPYELTKKHQIERYGFHGIAHNYSYNLFCKTYGPAKVISCHLGSGCSLAAIDKGVSLDTSMGFTPNEGVMMGTRSGDIDPSLFEFLAREEGFSIDDMQKILNYHSGLLGVSGLSASMEELIKSQSIQAQLAVELFCYRILKTIGAYAAALQGCEAILFSGGIGENAAAIRHKILSALHWLGVTVDDAKNRSAIKPPPGNIQEITTAESKIKSYVIGSDENRFIYEQWETLQH